MLTYTIRRLMFAIPTLVFISLIIFLLLELAPGDPMAEVPLTVPPEVKQKMREALGLGQPLHIRYFKWLIQFCVSEPLHILSNMTGFNLAGDAARLISWQSRSPIADIIAERIPQTLWVVGMSYVVGVLMALPLGIISAYKQYSWFDQLGTFIAMVGYSVPTFFTGVFLIVIFSVELAWFPSIYDTTLRVVDWDTFVLQFKQMVMPVFVLALYNAAQISRFMRASMLDNLNFRYSLIFFLSLLSLVILKAPVLGSYSEESKIFLEEELNFHWRSDEVGYSIFLERTNTRLAKYKSFFKEAAKEIDLHWTLIAAISYQESHWNPKAISDTGVRGMMMLTQKTAKEMGIKKRTNAEDSIFGGAKYFKKIMDRLPIDIPKQDRIWMSLAAYNLGFKNIELARDLTISMNLNPNHWSDVSIALERILLDRYGRESKDFVKHDQVAKYVDRINLYFATLSILYKDEELFLLAKK